VGLAVEEVGHKVMAVFERVVRSVRPAELRFRANVRRRNRRAGEVNDAFAASLRFRWNADSAVLFDL
jgi:hypothetical protein